MKDIKKIVSRLLSAIFIVALLGCDNGGAPPDKASSSAGRHHSVRAERTDSDTHSENSADVLARYKVSYHFRARMQERDVSAETVVDVIEHGQRFYDPKNDSNIRWKDDVYVAIAPDGTLKTVVRGRIENRWQPQ
jgi:hypothetical protein